MNFNSEAMGYSTSKDVLGLVTEVNFRNSTITLEDANAEFHVCEMSDVKVLDVVGYIGEEIVYNHDVILTSDGKKYEVELQEDGLNVKLHLLDENLLRLESGEKFSAYNIALLLGRAEVIGSVFQLIIEEPKSIIDFNIKLVRDYENGVTTYFYACNNKKTCEIDLIKVVFLGHHLLHEEQYERRTLSYQVFLESLEAETLIEASPQELLKYITDTTDNDLETMSQDSVDHDEDCECDLCRCDCENCQAYRDENFCNDCGKENEDCNCEW